MTVFAKFISFVVLLVITATASIEHNVLGGNPEVPVHIKLAHNEAVQEMSRQQHLFKDINCLARNIYYEARGESEQGQLAVAQVTLNRVESPMFPNTICGVVNERYKVNGQEVCQFSWRCDPKANTNLVVSETNPIFQLAWQAIKNYHSLDIVTTDTYWFHAVYVKPKWRKFKERVAKIDYHIFYRQK